MTNHAVTDEAANGAEDSPDEDADFVEQAEIANGASPSGVAALKDSNTPQVGDSASRLLRLISYVVVPVLTVGLAGAAAYFKYQDDTAANIDDIRTESVQIATEATVDLLSYTPDNVEAKLNEAGDRLTGSFRDSYLALVRETVIPGAKQKDISANATVAAGSSVSASRTEAKVMLFVNQTVTVGRDAPTESASVVDVNLDRVDGRWLVSGFEPR